MPDAPPCDPALLEETVGLVRRAAALALPGFRRSDLGIDHKDDGTVVTHYDHLVEQTLRDGLAAAHPEDAILGEEHGDTEGRSGRRWVLDPIDGTDPFARGVVTWGTLVACEDEHGPLVSVVCCPWLDGEVVYAGRGLGAWRDGVRVQASRRTELAGTLLVTSGVEWWNSGVVERLHAAGVKLKTWGNAYAVAIAATGRVDAFFDNQVKSWDIAPVPLLAAEAGARYGDLDGEPTVETGSGLLAPPALFDQLRELLRGTGAPPQFAR